MIPIPPHDSTGQHDDGPPTKSRDEWYDLLTRADVCVGEVYDAHKVFEDPQVRHRDMATAMGCGR